MKTFAGSASAIAVIAATLLASALPTSIAHAQSTDDARAERTPNHPPPNLRLVDGLSLDDRLELTHARHEYQSGVALTVMGALQLVPIAIGVLIAVDGNSKAQSGCPDCGLGVVMGETMAGISAAVAVALLTPGIVMTVRGRNRMRKILAPSVVPVLGGAALTWRITF